LGVPRGVDDAEIIDAVHARRPPMLPATAGHHPPRGRQKVLCGAGRSAPRRAKQRSRPPCSRSLPPGLSLACESGSEGPPPDPRSAVEHRPADVVPPTLVVEHEIADLLGK